MSDIHNPCYMNRNKIENVEAVGQPPQPELIRRGKLTGVVTTREDGTRVINWKDNHPRTISIDNVVYKR